MTIKLNLIMSLIVEAVKAETYIKGAVDRAAGGDQQATNAVSYHETAGDEDVHERKIVRGIYTSADKLRSLIQDYLVASGSSVSDNNTLNIDTDNDKIVFTLEVTDRFNKANSDALARLCSKYIEDNCLVLWWGTINANQMQYYANMLNEDVNAIRRLFIKKAPKAPSPTYTTTLNVSGTSITAIENEHNTITYIIDGGVIDDIDIVSSDNSVAHGEMDEGTVCIFAHNQGMCQMKLFSRHNTEISKTINVTVVK